MVHKKQYITKMFAMLQCQLFYGTLSETEMKRRVSTTVCHMTPF